MKKPVTRKYSEGMKMSSLVENDHRLLRVISTFGLGLGFGERTVDEICESSGVDTGTFLLVCEVYSGSGAFTPSSSDISRGHVNDIVKFLRGSHSYYLSTALVRLEGYLKEVVTRCPEKMQKVIRKFFDEYRSELERHFEFEEKTVYPYIQELLFGGPCAGRSIDSLEEEHSAADEKIGDLVSLVMKVIPPGVDEDMRMQLISFLYLLQSDFVAHTLVEDRILLPMVRRLENPRAWDRVSAAEEEKVASEGSEALSEREKEILVSVARGKLNKEIADEHGISIHTVISHRKNITRKTGIKTVAGLTAYALLNDLIDISTIE